MFDARCDHGGFKITVNEDCRLKYFAGVDFANSFLWGDSTKTIMVDPTKNDADAIVAGAVAAGTTCVPKPAAVSIADDTNDPYDIYTMLGYAATTKSWVRESSLLIYGGIMI